MKPKPLIIALTIIALAVIVVIVSKKSSGDPSPAAAENIQEPRSALKQSDPNSATRAVTHQGPTAPLEAWDERIDAYLSDDQVSVQRAAQGLLTIANNTTVPFSARLDALEHSLNLVDDNNFDMVLNSITPSDATIPSELMQAILDDTYNRPDHVQLATALTIMRADYPEIIDEAIELLEFHTEQKHGKDIEKWEQAVRLHINQNPQE